MELIKCENGHFYDLSKYDSCPYCKKKSQETSQLQQKIQATPVFRVQNDNINEAVTMAMPVGGDQDVFLGHAGSGISAGVSATDDQVTMAFYTGPKGVSCVTGWNELGRQRCGYGYLSAAGYDDLAEKALRCCIR